MTNLRKPFNYYYLKIALSLCTWRWGLEPEGAHLDQLRVGGTGMRLWWDEGYGWGFSNI